MGVGMPGMPIIFNSCWDCEILLLLPIIGTLCLLALLLILPCFNPLIAVVSPEINLRKFSKSS